MLNINQAFDHVCGYSALTHNTLLPICSDATKTTEKENEPVSTAHISLRVMTKTPSSSNLFAR